MKKLIGYVLLTMMTVAVVCILGAEQGCLPASFGDFGYWLKTQCWALLLLLVLVSFAVPIFLAILWSLLK